ncbi:hypothetical protein, partial [Flavobacterium sp.]|uniref:hypothetical protein n=1 Tax=Flavobacterium sp. TaxID=239 RepID=UPI0032674A98
HPSVVSGNAETIYNLWYALVDLCNYGKAYYQWEITVLDEKGTVIPGTKIEAHHAPTATLADLKKASGE